MQYPRDGNAIMHSQRQINTRIHTRTSHLWLTDTLKAVESHWLVSKLYSHIHLLVALHNEYTAWV